MTSLASRPWDIVKVTDCITIDRLKSYLRAVDGDLEAALVLYEWNIRACEALLGLASVVEVVVRNAIDNELRTWSLEKHGTETWFDHVPLGTKGAADIRTARYRATRGGREIEVHGKVIAELTLGFWRYIAELRYHNSLWVPAIHRAFGGGSADARKLQEDVVLLLRRIQFIRNRAAHHEPVHGRNLRKDLRAARSLVGWVSRDARAWLDEVERLEGVLSAKRGATRSERRGR